MSKPTPDDQSVPPAGATSGTPAGAPGPELRLIDRKAFVGLGAFDIAPGLRIADLALQIPNVSFPFNVTGGAARYQKQRCLFGELELHLSPSRVREAEEQILKSAPELARLRLVLRSGFIEAEGALRAGGAEPVPFTCRVAFDGAGDGVAALCFDVRLYAPCELPAPVVAGLLARAASRADLAPGVERRGFGGVSVSPLAELLRRTVPQKGFRLPEMSAARLGSALVSPLGITLRFSAGAPPPGGLADEELLLAVEGAHAFDEGERLLEQGALDRARTYFLRQGELAQAHPFATERLIALLLGDGDVADYALDLVRALAQRRPLSPAPLWMEGLLRLQRGERALAAARFLDLAALARGRGEEASAFWSAQAAARIASEELEQPKTAALAVRALHEALGLRPDHHPSLLALAQAAERAGDDAASLRAYRRLTAVAQDAAQAARAHVRLGELCARVENDLAGARLHYDAALRLLPDDADALLGLADLCARSGEPLRALRALDRVRALHPHDLLLGGRAQIEAGAVFEHALGQLENARLRYLEAARALPGDPAPRVRLGRVAERLDRVPEAVDQLTQALELLGPSASPLAHEAHRLLATIARDRHHDGARQLRHLQAAVALRPEDAEAWEQLIPLFRAEEAHRPLAEALLRASARAPELRTRVAMLVESAELLRLRLGDPAAARERYAQALALDPRARTALEGILALDEHFGEMGAACEHLRLLLELSPPGPARLPLLHRLVAAARDGKKDLDLAARATREILALVPDDLPALGELVALQRRRGDVAGLAEALEGWARGSERQGELGTTAAALRELASLFDARLGRRDDALSALEKAHALAPQDAGVLADLADLSLRLSRHRLARYATRALLALQPPEGAPGAPGSARRAELHERLARAAEAVGELAEAAAALEEAYRLLQDDGHAERLDALYALARRDDARIDLARRRGTALTRAGKGTLAARVLAQGAALSRAVGDLPGAVRDFTAALAADPTGPEATPILDALAELATAAGQPGEAAGHLSKRAALTPDARLAARLLHRAAQLCLGVDEPRAVSLLASAAARDPQFAPARAALAERRARAADVGAAWRDAEAALEIDPRDPDALDASALASLEKLAARWAEQAGDRAAAARLLGRLLQRNPGDVEALTARVSLLRALGDVPALVGALEQLEGQLSGARAVAVARELATLHGQALGRIDLAVAAHRRVLQHDPEDRTALEALAALLDGPSEVDARVEVLARLAALARSGEEAAAFQLRRGEALQQALRHADAAQAFALAAQTAPDPGPALARLVQAAEEAGQPKVALVARRDRAELAARRGEPGAAEGLLEVAERFLAGGEPEAAAQLFSQVAALSPEPAQRRVVHGRLAELARTRGQTREVLTHLRALAALVEGPERLAALRGAAEAAIALGEVGAARDALQEALPLAPGAVELSRSLVDVQHRLGDLEGEVEALLHLARLAEPPEAAEAFVRAARLLGAEHPARAEASLRAALRLQPDRPDLRGPLVELLLGRGEVREAVLLLEQGALQGADAVQAASALLRAAELAEGSLLDAPLALRLSRAAFQRAPDAPGVLRALAERSYRAGAVAEAAPLLSRLLDLDDGAAEPERWIGWALALADLRREQGQPELAVKVLSAAAALAPWRADVASALHEAERGVDPRAALERLTAALAGLHPGTALHALQRRAADAALALDQQPLAASLLEQALETATLDRDELEEQLIALHTALGHTRAAVGLLRTQAQRAAQAGEGALAVKSLSAAAALLEQGEAAAEAVALWGRVVELQLEEGRLGEAAAALLHRGRLLRGHPQTLAEAEADLRRAFELDPALLSALRLAQEVARERQDPQAEAELLTLEHDRLDEVGARAQLLLRRAELEAGPLAAPARAEATLRAALALDPLLASARDRYDALLRAGDRPLELAHSLLARAAGSAPAAAVGHLREAARLFNAAGQPALAAEALLQARGLAPADESLALAAAEALSRAGRPEEAAFIDAALLSRDPTREPCFARELARRAQQGDTRGQAALSEARALAEPPEAAAVLFLRAAELYDQAGEPDAARRCELWAFERLPRDPTAFARVVARHQAPAQLRVLDGILRRRAHAVESEAAALHLQRAERLLQHDELEDARQALDEALQQEDEATQGRALWLRAEVEVRLEGPAAAARFDERLVMRTDLSETERVAVLVRLAETRAQAGRDADAAALWEAALAGAPREVALSTQERLISTYARLGAVERQAQVLLARAELVPAERATLLRAAVELVPAGPLALRALTALAERDADPASLLKLARLELSAGEPRGRDRLVEAARAAVVPSIQAALLLEASRLFESAGDGLRARGLRSEARKVDAHSLPLLRQVAADLREGGPVEERREVLTALVELESDLEARAAFRQELGALLLAHDPQAAHAQLAAWAGQLPPSDAAALWRQLADLAQAHGWTARRAEALEELAAREPAQAPALALQAAQLWADAGELARARAAAGRAAASGEDPAPLRFLLQLAERTGEDGELARAHEALAARLPLADRQRSLLAAAEHHAKAGRPEAQLAALRQAAELPPEQSALHGDVARLALSLGQLDLAQQALRAAARLSSAAERPALLTALAELADRRGDALSSEAAWQELWSAGLQPELAFARLAALLASRGARRELAQLHGERAERAPTFDAHLAAAHAFGDAESPREALSHWQAAVALRPDDLGALRGLAEAAARAGDPDALLQALSALAPREAEPRLRAGLYQQAAGLQTARGDVAGALASLRAAAEAEPASAARQADLVDALEAAGAWAEAAERLGAVEAPSAAITRRRAGLLLRAGKRLQAGLAQVELLAEDPADLEVIESLRMLARSLGDDERPALLAAWARRAPRVVRASLYLELAGLQQGAARRSSLESAFAADPAGASFGPLRELLVEADDDAALAALLEKRAGAVADPAERGRLLMELGELYEGVLEALPQALDAYERSLAAFPSNLGVQRDLAELCFELGKDDRARALYLALASAAQGAARAPFLERLVELAVRAGRPDEAVVHLEERLTLGPSAGLLLQLRGLAVQAGDRAAELRALSAIAREEAIPEPERVDALRRQIALLRERGAGAEALAAASALVALRPEELEGWRALHALARAEQDQASELQAVRALAAREPEPHARAMMLLEQARLLGEQGSLAEAASAAMAAHALTPTDALALREAVRWARAGKLSEVLVEAGVALHALAGDGAVAPFARELGEALDDGRHAPLAFRLLTLARAQAPTDRALLERLVGLARAANAPRAALELARELARDAEPSDAAARLRALAQTAETELADPALAAELYADAFTRGVASDDELGSQAERLAALGRGRDAAVALAELARRVPADRARWSRLAEGARRAQVNELVRASEALDAFLAGGLPELPSQPALAPEVRADLLGAIAPAWREALLAVGRARWAGLPAAAAGLRPGGPVLSTRLQAIADLAGVPRPAVRMDPGSAGVLFAGPDTLVVGIGLFSLPARAQDYVLALAMVRAALALPFASEGMAALLQRLQQDGGLAAPAPAPEALEAVAEALAAAVVDDGLGALVGRTVTDPAYAGADPRAWDRLAALQGPAQHGAAAVLAAALARLRAPGA